MQISLGGNSLRKCLAGIGLGEERLALEVGSFDEISVNKAEASDPGADEQIGCGGTNRTTSNQYRAGGADALLPFRAKRRKQNLARVFLVQRVNHVK